MHQNLIKKFTSLSYAKYRKLHNQFIVEGEHCVKELVKSNWDITQIITSESVRYRFLDDLVDNKQILQTVEPKIIKKIATTKTPQDIIAIASIPEHDFDIITNFNKILITDSIKDPGNMGTIIRSAAAFGFDAIITVNDSVDIYNPKVVRATQGAMFHIAVFPNMVLKSVKSILRENYSIFALLSEGETKLENIEIPEKATLIIGSEIDGVSPGLFGIAHHRVKIPMTNKVESLNAAVAASIAMQKLGDCEIG